MKDSCRDCIHANVCGKKEKFEKLMKEVESIKLSDGTQLLEADEFKVVVNCRYYQQDFNKVFRGAVEVLNGADMLKNIPTNL